MSVGLDEAMLRSMADRLRALEEENERLRADVAALSRTTAAGRPSLGRPADTSPATAVSESVAATRRMLLGRLASAALSRVTVGVRARREPEPALSSEPTLVEPVGVGSGNTADAVKGSKWASGGGALVARQAGGAAAARAGGGYMRPAVTHGRDGRGNSTDGECMGGHGVARSGNGSATETAGRDTRARVYGRNLVARHVAPGASVSHDEEGVYGEGVTGVRGRSGKSAGSGVHGENSGPGTGVRGTSVSGYGAQFQGGKAQLRLAPAVTLGQPRAGAHLAGELFLDSAATLWLCVASGAPGTWKRVALE